MTETKPLANYFFEVSYEVANKVGGIYAVIASKSEQMMKYYGKNYYTIGYYTPRKRALTSRRKILLIQEDLRETREDGHKMLLRDMGISKRQADCILINVDGYKHRTNDIKGELWMKYKIDSLHSDSWFGDPVAWSYAAGILLEQLETDLHLKKTVAQFHEWMAGVALLYLKSRNSKIATVFTTHATMLGRTMANYNDNMVKDIDNAIATGKTIDPKKAYEYSVEAKHQTECACAKTSDIFTTVSDITGRESQYILGKKPDVILPNGLDLEKFPSMEECIYLHHKYKQKILDFLLGYFKPYYEINLSNRESCSYPAATKSGTKESTCS